MKTNKSKFQSNQYDKIFKENLEAVIPNLMKNVLGIIAISSEELQDDIQHTKERKPDVLKKITDEQGNIFILHIEFQVVDEPKMVYRMAEYHIMLSRKYELPVEQFVIYLGTSTPKMITKLESKRMKFDFPLIAFIELDYKIFLNSNKPEEIILGILANFKQEKSENALKQIIQRIEETSDGDFSLKRYFNQLRVLAQLRNLEPKIGEYMESITTFFDEERDILVIRAKRKFVENLLKESELALEKIAKIAGVSIDFVINIQQKLSTNK